MLLTLWYHCTYVFFGGRRGACGLCASAQALCGYYPPPLLDFPRGAPSHASSSPRRKYRKPLPPLPSDRRLCVCVHPRVCHLCLCACMHVHLHVCTMNIYLCACVHVFLRVCTMCVCLYACMLVYLRVCAMCVCVCVYVVHLRMCTMCVCLRACMYVNMCVCVLAGHSYPSRGCPPTRPPCADRPHLHGHVPAAVRHGSGLPCRSQRLLRCHCLCVGPALWDPVATAGGTHCSHLVSAGVSACAVCAGACLLRVGLTG
jgi:hypothetical protein